MKRHGYTLAELLVSLAVLSAMSLALVLIYSAAGTVFERGGGRLQLQQRTREAIRRIGPLVASAIPPTEDKTAIIAPVVGASAAAVDFYSAEDYFGSAVFDPRAASYFSYRLGFSAPNVMLWRIDSVGNPMASPAPRVIARGFTAVAFTRVALDSVRMTLTSQAPTRDARGQATTVTCSLETMLQVPYYGVRQ